MSLPTDRRKIFMQGFEVLCAAYNRDYNKSRDKDLFMELAEEYLGMSNSIPTNHLRTFLSLRNFSETFPTPVQYMNKVNEYIRSVCPKEDDEIPEATEEERAFGIALMKAVGFGLKAKRINKNLAAVQSLVVRTVYKRFQKNMPAYWINQINSFNQEEIESAKNYIRDESDKKRSEQGFVKAL